MPDQAMSDALFNAADAYMDRYPDRFKDAPAAKAPRKPKEGPSPNLATHLAPNPADADPASALARAAAVPAPSGSIPADTKSLLVKTGQEYAPFGT